LFRGRLHSSLRRPGHPHSASNMTTWVNSQFPRPDFHRQVQRHYGLQDTLNPGEPYQGDPNRPNYNPYDHDLFFQDAVVPCFEMGYQAGGISLSGKSVAQPVVPVRAGALRESVWDAYQLYKSYEEGDEEEQVDPFDEPAPSGPGGPGGA